MVDCSNVSEQNDDYRYILTVIDSWSKKAWARLLKDKTALTVLTAFASVIDNSGIPEQLCCDQGKGM